MPEAGAANGRQTPLLHTVGVALLPGKAEKHLKEKLIDTALARGIQLKVIDHTRPLEEQGRLEAILHKIRLPEWEQKLIDYQKIHPEVVIIDAPLAIRKIGSRASMLASLGTAGFVVQPPETQPDGQPLRICSPIQIPLTPGCSPQEARDQLNAAGLQPPFVAKPLWADGREGAHGLAVLADTNGVDQILRGDAPDGMHGPLLLSQYLDHGGCLFKVYVMGPVVVLARRPSLHLPVDPGDILEQQGSVTAIARVSAYHSDTWRGDAPLGNPPAWAVQAIAQELRRRLGLTLFNFDLIQPDPSHAGRYPAGADYICIDINYFPGYEKLPDYEGLMTDFLVSLFSEQPERQLCRFVSCRQPAGRRTRSRPGSAESVPATT